jgi:hypothetical protein
MRHLNDEEIQEFLDAGGEGVGSVTLDHLRTCSRCRSALESYRTLYAGLADKAAFEPPRDLAASVTSRLGLRALRCPRALPADLILVACAILAMVIAVSIFADLRPLTDTVTAIGRPVIDYLSPGLQSVVGSLRETSQTTSLILSGVAVLILMGAIDVVFRRGRAARVP